MSASLASSVFRQPGRVGAMRSRTVTGGPSRASQIGMRLAIEALDVSVADEVLLAAAREVTARAASSVFAGVRDVRLRLRQARGALLCVAAVGFAGGGLVTSSATRDTPLEAIVGALEGLPDRIDRVYGRAHHPSAESSAASSAAVREQLKRLLDEA